jgi:hypothetical protein
MPCTDRLLFLLRTVDRDRLQPLTGSVDLQAVLSTNMCDGPCCTDVAWMTGSVTARRLTVV